MEYPDWLIEAFIVAMYDAGMFSFPIFFEKKPAMVNFFKLFGPIILFLSRFFRKLRESTQGMAVLTRREVDNGVRGRPKMTSAFDIRRPDPSPLPDSHSTKMVHTLGFKLRPPILGRQLFPTPSPLPSG